MFLHRSQATVVLANAHQVKGHTFHTGVIAEPAKMAQIQAQVQGAAAAAAAAGQME